jgi:hypothetical protein
MAAIIIHTVTVVIYYEEWKSASGEQAGHPKSMETGRQQNHPHLRLYILTVMPMRSANKPGRGVLGTRRRTYTRTRTRGTR